MQARPGLWCLLDFPVQLYNFLQNGINSDPWLPFHCLLPFQDTSVKVVGDLEVETRPCERQHIVYYQKSFRRGQPGPAGMPGFPGGPPMALPTGNDSTAKGRLYWSLLPPQLFLGNLACREFLLLLLLLLLF